MAVVVIEEVVTTTTTITFITIHEGVEEVEDTTIIAIPAETPVPLRAKTNSAFMVTCEPTPQWVLKKMQ